MIRSNRTHLVKATEALMTLVLLFQPTNDVAAQLPAAGTLECLGMNISGPIRGSQSEDLIQAAGVKCFRTGLPWWYVERTYGVYDFTSIDYDRMVEDYNARGIRVEFILSGSGDGKPPAAYGTDPSSDAYQNGFAAFCAAAAARYKGKGVIFEIWNEPNVENGGNLSPDTYMALMKKAARAIRRADPEATIIGPATSTIELDYLTACFRLGLLDVVDAVSVHPYRSYTNPTAPETVVPEYQSLRKLIEQHHPNGMVPIVCSEWGYSTVMPGITEEIQGDYLARILLINLSEGIVQTNWFDWKDEGVNPACFDHHFGTLTHGNVPKPAHERLQSLVAALKGKAFDHRIPSNPDDWLLVFASPDGERTLAAWTVNAPHTVALQGWDRLDLTSTPIYVNLLAEPHAQAAVGNRASEVGLRESIATPKQPDQESICLTRAKDHE